MEPVGRGAFDRIAVIGHGLIGGSIALAVAARSPGVRVITLDRGDDISAVDGADLIVLATPISEILRLLPALAAIVPATAVVTDTGSTKSAIVNAAPPGMRFIGGHPIAGAEVPGRAAARADLFVGRPWILTPTDAADRTDIDRLQRFVDGLGAHARLLPSDEHDRLFAFLSHLPQLVVSALMDVVGCQVGEDALAMAGQGLRDTTRLATSPPDIWRDIVRTNDRQVRTALDGLISLLTTLRDDPSGDALAETFARAARWKSALDDGSL